MENSTQQVEATLPPDALEALADLLLAVYDLEAGQWDITEEPQTNWEKQNEIP
ncbi:MAG: hypothetical protein OEQ39_25845 [Gammaproteobacteria bacterium]|nr:hypothetical protein [Gammaproteobacteria bacterium]